MCPSGATCLPVDCCFSELAIYKSNSQNAWLSGGKLDQLYDKYRHHCARHCTTRLQIHRKQQSHDYHQIIVRHLDNLIYSEVDWLDDKYVCFINNSFFLVLLYV
jgi:hypothetical protein